MELHYTSHARSTYYFESAVCTAYLPFSGGTATGECRGQSLTPAGQGHFAQAVTWRFCDVDVPF